MEEQKENTARMYKVRSYLSCFNEGVKLPTQNILPLLRFLWPSLLISAIVAALWAVFCNTVTVPLAQWMSASGSLILNIPFWTIFILTLLSVVSASLYLGQLVAAIRHYASMSTLSNLSLRKSIRPILDYSLSSFVFILISLFVMVLAAGLPAYFFGIRSVWNLIILSFVILVFLVPFAMVIWDNLLNENNNSILKSFSRIKDGYRYWVAFFIISLYAGVIISILMLVVWLPSSVLAYTEYLSYMQLLEGDKTDLPAYTSVLTVILFAVSTVLTSLFLWIKVFPMAFLYATIETRNEEERIYIENSKIK